MPAPSFPCRRSQNRYRWQWNSLSTAGGGAGESGLFYFGDKIFTATAYFLQVYQPIAFGRTIAQR